MGEREAKKKRKREAAFLCLCQSSVSCLSVSLIRAGFGTDRETLTTTAKSIFLPREKPSGSFNFPLLFYSFDS